jgi:hypothetical protein
MWRTWMHSWGRMIFYVADVDAFWEYLRGQRI